MNGNVSGEVLTGTISGTVKINGDLIPRGIDGYSPTIELEPIDGGSRIIITDINGTKQFEVQSEVSSAQIAELVTEYLKNNRVVSSWNDLEDKPEGVGYTEYVTGAILADNITVTKGSGNLLVSSWLNYTKLAGADMVRITFDGVTYECPVEYSYDDVDGNSFIIRSENYPFSFWGFENINTTVMGCETGSHTLSFCLLTDGEVHKIDAIYLPDELYQEIANKIGAEDLSGAVNTALAQAKASGEFDGKDGKDGKDGSNGVSATHSWSGTTLTVTSASGTSSANLKGEKGDSIKGDPGTDGVSPTVSISKSGKVTTVSITDKNGTKTATINDGADGAAGKDGTPATHSWNGTTLTITSASGTSSADLRGVPGKDGSNGKDGYTPQKNVDYFDGKDGSNGKDGVSVTHSWNGTTLNITSASGTSSANLKGEPGTDGISPTVSVSKSGKVTTVSITDKNGTKTTTINDGEKGDTGSRGFSVLKITTAPSGYTTATGGFTPTYRVALSTVLSQSKAADVVVGDTVIYSYYTYPVGYVDSSYVYLGARTSIRGATGAAGTSVTISSVSESTEDGGSNVVTFSNSNTLTVKNGKDGRTPVKGVDYQVNVPAKGIDFWTEADQESIVQQVIVALGTPVFGTVDADNNIILTGDLPKGTYTLKYEDADGNVTEVGTISNIETSGEIPLNIVVGKIDSSTGAISSAENYAYSDMIAIEAGKTYTIDAKNVCAGYKIAYYNASGAFMSCTANNLNTCESGVLANVNVDVPIISGAAYFRLRIGLLWYNNGYAPSAELVQNNTTLVWNIS